MQSIIRASAEQRGVEVSFDLTGVCDYVDSAYRDIALATGGSLNRMNVDEIPKAFQNIAEPPKSFPGAILEVRDTVAPALPQSYLIPIEPATNRFEIRIDGDLISNIEIFRPDGRSVSPQDPDVVLTQLYGSMRVQMLNPAAGSWHTRISGDGSLSVTARSNKVARIISAKTVKLIHPYVHTGYAEITSNPPAGRQVRFLVRQRGFDQVDQVQLIGLNGAALSAPSIQTGDPFVSGSEVSFDAVVPAEPFRIAITGKSAGYTGVYRVSENTFYPARAVIEINIANVPRTIAAGVQYHTYAHIKNFGPDLNYQVLLDKPDWVSVDANAIEGALNENGDIRMNLSIFVPANAVPSKLASLVFVLKDSNSGEFLSTASLEFRVASTLFPASPTDAQSENIVDITPTPGSSQGVQDLLPTYSKFRCTPRKLRAPGKISCSIKVQDDHGVTDVFLVVNNKRFKFKKDKKGNYKITRLVKKLPKKGLAVTAIVRDTGAQIAKTKATVIKPT